MTSNYPEPPPGTLPEPVDPRDRLWRTLVRLTGLALCEDTFWFVLPFESEHQYAFPLSELPSSIFSAVVDRFGTDTPYLHVWCNIGEPDVDARVFSGWESR